MKTSIICLWLGLMTMSASGYAQDGATVPLNLPAERARITGERAGFDAGFMKKQQGCYERFAVSDCLNRARRERRVALDELRRQEVGLNKLERQAKALAELERIQSNSSPEYQQELELRRQQALLSTQERQRPNDEKKAAITKPVVAATPVVSSVPPAVGPEYALNQQQRYLEKLKEAQQRKADKARALSQQGKNFANPLPIPPSQ
jgi:hypothetical protein